MAPEVVKQTGHTEKADIWSVGCLVVEMLTGTHPWPDLNQLQAMYQVSLLLLMRWNTLGSSRGRLVNSLLPLYPVIFRQKPHISSVGRST
jgi:serine/threonine protein kinase